MILSSSAVEPDAAALRAEVDLHPFARRHREGRVVDRALHAAEGTRAGPAVSAPGAGSVASVIPRRSRQTAPMAALTPVPIQVDDDGRSTISATGCAHPLARARDGRRLVAGHAARLRPGAVRATGPTATTGARAEARAQRASRSSATEIDGLGIHFLHVARRTPDALPLVLTHGWPGSVVEFLKVIGPLTDPTAHGGDAADAFHVVCPSLPGYGFCDKPDATGWGVERIADAWAELMAAPRLRPLRRAGRRLGLGGHDRRIGRAGPRALPRHPPQHADRRARADRRERPHRPRSGRRSRRLEHYQQLGLRLLDAAVDATADRSATGSSTRPPARRVDPREVLGVDRPRRHPETASPATSCSTT